MTSKNQRRPYTTLLQHILSVSNTKMARSTTSQVTYTSKNIQHSFFFNVSFKTILVCFVFALAPGSYDVEKSDKAIHQASAISFGVKYKDQKLDDIPGN